MPGLLLRSAQFGNATAAVCSPSGAVGSMNSNGIWSKQRDDITFDQLQKFWSELPPHARQKLLRIDKQTLFEQARKNLYCSRCNGLLLEGFSQIVLYGKSLQQEGAGMQLPNRTRAIKIQIDKESDDAQDPSVHPWGGLATTRDGILTLLDCFIDGKSLKAIQNVFDSARARERERELLYPDACGGGGRGWISQGMANYGRGHGTRETCALHTARLSCDTLVDFWSALGDDTRLSLLRMKEEDFIERLMYRFDSKRFCRDCRRNVIREFKELKELKRMRREPRCTSWFCVADTAFQYEVSQDTVQADWHQTFTDTVGTYHHFEWAIGTGEGKSDILDFEDVGMNGKVQVNGLDLGSLSTCFITMRAWKLDGRCTEFSVKAHALKGQPCVHRRLVVGDGFVTITKGESIRRFFEHAEEVEEEEAISPEFFVDMQKQDDDAIDKDGNELDADGSRPQKHAKSPELAREFLLDAATVIFKEQVEKAFREGTARQNAHSIFVCLALKLLEERVHVACKEIITLEKQIKLLEEEEKERREEEVRKERRRTKEREKKLRRKERLKGKEREREREHIESKSLHIASPTAVNDAFMNTHDEPLNTLDFGDSISEPGDITLSRPISPDITDEQSLNGCIDSKMRSLKSDSLRHQCQVDGELNARDGNGCFTLDQSKSSRRQLRFKKDSLLGQVSKWYDKRRSIISNEVSGQHDESVASSRDINGVHRASRANPVKINARNCGLKFSEKFHCSNNRTRDRYHFHPCSCNQHGDYRAKDGYHISTIRSGREFMAANKTESALDMPRSSYRSSKYNHGCYVPDNSAIPKGKLLSASCNIPPSRDVFPTKQVWEPTDSRNKCIRNNSDPDFTLRTASMADQSGEVGCNKHENGCQPPGLVSPDDQCSSELSGSSGKVDGLSGCQSHEGCMKNSNKSCPAILNGCQNGFSPGTKSGYISKNGAGNEVDSCPIMSKFPMSNNSDPIMSSSSSDNCSSCLSEGDSSTSSSSTQNAESSSTSDSEDVSQLSEVREILTCTGNPLSAFPDNGSDGKYKTNGRDHLTSRTTTGITVASCIDPRDESTKVLHSSDKSQFGFDMAPQQPHMLPMHNQSIHMPVFPIPRMGYHQNQTASSWSAAPANRLVPFPQPNHYFFQRPLGFGVPANQSSEFCIQYNALHPLATPVVNIGQSPLYQTINKVNIASSKDQPHNSKTCAFQQANGVAEAIGSVQPLEKSFPSRQLSSEPPSTGQNGSVGNSTKSFNDSSSFSLFHSGGPLAGASRCSMNQKSLKEESTGGFSSNSPAVQSDLTCSKKDITVEEYSLFAASNGSRFSFF